MSAPTCSISDCNYDAKERCAGCGQVFCTSHITSTILGYYCDSCMAEEHKKFARQERKYFLVDWLVNAVSAFFKYIFG